MKITSDLQKKINVTGDNKEKWAGTAGVGWWKETTEEYEFVMWSHSRKAEGKKEEAGNGRIQNNRLSCWLLTAVTRATVAIWVWLIVVVQVHSLGGKYGTT